jgi:hypothetical protein
LVDALDSKSSARKGMPVRPRPSAPELQQQVSPFGLTCCCMCCGNRRLKTASGLQIDPLSSRIQQYIGMLTDVGWQPFNADAGRNWVPVHRSSDYPDPAGQKVGSGSLIDHDSHLLQIQRIGQVVISSWSEIVSRTH